MNTENIRCSRTGPLIACGTFEGCHVFQHAGTHRFWLSAREGVARWLDAADVREYAAAVAQEEATYYGDHPPAK